MIDTIEDRKTERIQRNSEEEMADTVPCKMTHRAKHSKHSSSNPLLTRSRIPNQMILIIGVILYLSTWRSVQGIEMDICQEKSCYPATGNLLIGREKRMSTTSTCGVRRIERYCIVSHLEDKKKCFFCNSTRPWMQNVNERSHQISNIVSERISERKGKWWQSENGVANVSIRLDLEAEFHFTHLIITFKTFRPAAMLIERSSDFGKSWHTYRYFAYECGSSFPGIPEGPPTNHSDVICTSRYSNVAPSSGGEVVFKVLSPHIPLEDPYADHIQKLLKITNLRVNFTKLHTLGDDLLDYRPEIDEKYYYAIYDMVVRGSCSCYGHASKCVPKRDDNIAFVNYHRPDMVHGTCECTHHTAGLNCEKCEDFFNDAEWKPAIDNEINACRRCNCNNHANRCHFDAAVWEASGQVSGGVCDECQHNTVGKNCEQCKPMFYRDMARDLTDPYVCLPCQCDPQGSSNDGVCETHTDEEKKLEAGRCQCKENVGGKRCDRCKHGFWDMREDDEKGCKQCSCLLMGTVGNEGCDKRTGACTCKRLVTGEKCDQCLENHYGLSEEPNGCKPCDCNIGGSYEEKCDVMTGQCRCRPNFSGRKCDVPESGYFCANIDYYTYEAEEAMLEGGAEIEMKEPVKGTAKHWTGTGYAKARYGSRITFNITNLAVSQYYNIILRFNLELPYGWQSLDVAVIRENNVDPAGPCANIQPIDDMTTVQLRPQQGYHEVDPAICFEQGVLTKVRLSFGEAVLGNPDRAPTMSVDSIVLAPPTDSLEIFKGDSVKEYHLNEYKSFQCRHSALSLPRSTQMRPECQKYFCPVAAITIEKGLVCNCNETGSTSGICSIMGGQCECKSNVIGRTCDKCAPGTYGFGTKGCLECQCNSVGSLHNFCEINGGQCVCRDGGITGRACDQCNPGFWSFATKCRPCECNGHADLCDQETGACIECRDLTDGHQCERCKDGYYGDPRIGSDQVCRPCPCPNGPGSGAQHADTCYLDPRTENVVCNCKMGYSGEKCDSCIANYWGSPKQVAQTCEKCDCNGNIDMRVPESCDAESGKCLKCLHNTEGDNCEHCVANYYGDATIRQCTKCVCNILGTNATAGPCDRVTGQCPCLPNVVGRNCDQCEVNHWQLAMGTGCAACECDPTGVREGEDGKKLLQCNEFDGKCQCKYERGGRTCSECQDYFYGDPTLDNCQRCECNPTGSSSLQCDRDTGNCQCQKEFGGKNCDQCARGYTGQWPNCAECGECFQNWDEILQDLNKEAEMLVDRANNIEDTGVASVYDKEFQMMEKKLETVKNQLDTANVSKADVDELKEKMEKLGQTIQDSRDKLNQVDELVTERTAEVDTEEEALKELQKNAAEVVATAKELEMNETKLRQTDSLGAYNITRESARKSQEAKAAADATDAAVRASETKRNEANDLLNRNQDDFELQYSENQDALNALDEKIKALEAQIPDINEKVCGAAGDPCDETCGGALCGSCGGDNCGDGAVPKSEEALDYAQQAAERLEQKQKEATELLQRVRTALDTTAEAKNNAVKAYETAKRTRETANMTKAGLEELNEKIKDFLKKDAATPQNIREVSEAVLNKSISLSPEQIRELGRQIQERLNGLQNIDAILAETRGNLTRANALKEEADLAKERAEAILNTTTGVEDALKIASEAQDKARQAIKNAGDDIETTNEDLESIKLATEGAQKAAKESNDSLAEVKDKLLGVSTEYVDIARDLAKAEKQAADAKEKIKEAEETKQRLEESFNEAEGKIGSKEGNGKVPKKRAQELKDKAAKLLQKTRQYVDDIEKNKAKFGANEISLGGYNDELEALLNRINLAAVKIAAEKNRYETCD